MKKYIPIAVLSLALMGCTNSNAPAGEDNKDSQIEEENKDDQKKVIEVSKPDESEEKESKEIDTEDEDKEETDESKKVDKDINDKEEDEKEKIDKKEEEKEEKPSEEKESPEEEKQGEKDKVTADDLFFLPYGSFSSVNENGELVDENGNPSPNESSNQYEYVKYTNNVFVKMKNDLYGQVSIVRMNDKDVSTLYEFPEGEEFASLGMIGDRVYGFHYYKSKSDIDGTPSLETDKTALAYVDLASGKVFDYEDTIDVQTGGAVVIDGQLQFTKPGDNAKENVYNYDLYKLDLTKGLDQKAELVEKNFDLQYLFGQKKFVDGKAVWNILRADNDNIYANDQKFPFLWAEAGYQEIIGNNIFYFPLDAKGEGETDRSSTSLKVINISSGETVLEEIVRGIKIADGKLYYITKDNQLESVDVEL